MRNKGKDAVEPKNISIIFFIIFGLTVILIQAAASFSIFYYLTSWSERASFGEMFGGINTLFSGLAFAGVIYAFLLQRRELELQRRELQMNRDELKRSAEAQEATAKSQAVTEKALEEQAKALQTTARLNFLTFLPALVCEAKNQEQRFVVVSNMGRSFAFDVEVLLLYRYHDEFSNFNTFVDAIVRDARKSGTLAGDVESRLRGEKTDAFTICSHFKQSIFPHDRALVIKLLKPLSIFPHKVSILIQYRDIHGDNYHQACTFWASALTGGYNQARAIALEF